MASDTTIRISAIDQTREAFRSVQSNISGLTGSLKSIAGPIAAAFSVAAIGAFAKSVIDTADALGDLSEQTGITVRELSSLGNAAQLNGSSAEEFNEAIVKFQKSLAEAQKGVGSQSDAFKTLGISIKNTDGSFKDTTTVFYEFADAMSVTEEGTVKTAVAQDLLGRSGQKLIPVLNQGSEALKTFQATFDDDFAKRAGEFNDNISKMGKTFQSLAITITGPVISAFNSFIERMRSGMSLNQLKELKAQEELFNSLEASIGKAATATGKIARVRVDSAKAAADEAKELARLAELDKERIKDTEERIKQNQHQLRILGLLDSPMDKYNEKLRALDHINKLAGLSSKQYLDILFEINNAYNDAIPAVARYNEVLAPGIEGLQKYSKATKDAKTQIDSFAMNSLQSLEDALVGVMSGTVSVANAFRSMAMSIVKDLIRIHVQRTITGPLADALGGMFGGGATTTGGNLGGGLRVPGAAIGGSVSRGSPYMVGERGPEMFIPNSSGSIVPNDKMGGGSTNNIVVNVNMENGSVNATDGNRLGVLVGNIVKGELVKQTRPGGLLAA